MISEVADNVPQARQGESQVAGAGPVAMDDVLERQFHRRPVAEGSGADAGYESSAGGHAGNPGSSTGQRLESAHRPEPVEGQPAADDPQPTTGNPQPASADAEPVFTDRHINAARRFGLEAADLEALGERGPAFAERLAKAHSDIGRRYSEIGRAERLRASVGTGNALGPVGGGELPVAGNTDYGSSSTSPQPATDNPQAASDATPEAALRREFKQLRQYVSALAGELEEENKRRRSTAGEQFFAGLDAGSYPQFGVRVGGAGAGDGEPARNREELLTKADEILRGYQIVHGEPMDYDQALRQALAIVAGPAQLAAAKRQLAQDIQRRHDMRLPRPSQQGGQRQFGSPVERTRQALDEWEKSRGVRFFED